MKKEHYIITIFLICITSLCFSQIKEGKCYLSPVVQWSSDLHFKFAYSLAYGIYTGQPFTFKATNVSGKRIRATFKLVALTMCDTEVFEEFDIAFEPNESIGYGNALFDNDYIASVTKKNCNESVQVVYTFKGKQMKGQNLIKNIYIKDLVINPLPKKVANSANETSNLNKKRELSDDEKLNQAMMKNLEKEFDNNKNKKAEPIIIKPAPNVNNNPKSSNGNKKKNNAEVEMKIKEYKEKITGILNNLSYSLSNTEVQVLYNDQKIKSKVKDQTI